MPSGCCVSLKDYAKAQALFDAIPALLERKKLNGKDLPTEVFIKKKSTYIFSVIRCLFLDNSISSPYTYRLRFY